MKRAALIGLFATAAAILTMVGCEGCALTAPEGEATMSSGPSLLSVFSD